MLLCKVLRPLRQARQAPTKLAGAITTGVDPMPASELRVQSGRLALSENNLLRLDI